MSALPIRILHLADLHLGIESYGRLDPATGLSGRVGDFLRGLDQAIDEAVGGDIDLVIFAGDYYRTRDPNPTHQRELAKRIQRLADAAIPTFLLAGNHDLPLAQGRASSIDIFEALTVPHVTSVMKRPELKRLETRRGPIQIVGLPWVYRGGMLTREEYRGKSLDEINEMIIERLDRGLRHFVDQLEPDSPRVLVAHASVQGAIFGSERQVMLGQDIVLPRAIALDPAFDYIALGHIHRHQIVSTEPLAIYPGSIDRVDFGEEREDKGYVVAQVWRGGADYQFRPTPARRFVTINVTVEGDDAMDQAMAAVERANVADAVVRVQINVAPEQEAQVDVRAIRAALRDSYFVAYVAKRVDRRFRARLGDRFAEEMTPLQALEAYLISRQEPPDHVKRLLELAEPLVKEVSLT